MTAQHTPGRFTPTPYCQNCGKLIRWGSYCSLPGANAMEAARDAKAEVAS